jgi:hypothetical protein
MLDFYIYGAGPFIRLPGPWVREHASSINFRGRRRTRGCVQTILGPIFIVTRHPEESR